MGIMWLAMASCREDDLVKRSSVVEGQPITVTMKFSSAVPSDVVVTRADDNSFSNLSNLIIFIYNHTTGEYEQIVSSMSGSLTFSSAGDNLYAATFNTTSGAKDLLAVANTSSVAEDGGFWENLSYLGTLAQTSSFEELKEAVIHLRNELRTQNTEIQPIQIVSSSQMLISGWNTGVVFYTDGSVSSYGDYGDAAKNVVVRMERAMARISFNIEAAPEGASGTFTPTSYRVYNIPVNSFLTNMNTADPQKTNPEDGFEFINYVATNIGTASGGSYSFSFYMPENVYDEVLHENKNLEYNDRDRWDSSGDNTSALPGEKKWIYAPQTSTFVVISGNYSGTMTDKDTGETTSYVGNVEYTVHLGDFSSKTGNYSNFSVERNCSYTYNLTVLGVNNIIVEATKEEDELQPGAEGEIFDNTHTVYNYQLDAHYEQVYLEYNLTNIAGGLIKGLSDGQTLDNAIADNLILLIQSEAMDYTHTGEDYTVRNKRGTLKPYKLYADAVRNNQDPASIKENILEGAGIGNFPTKGFDYRWIEFWPQKEKETLASYPGVSEWSREDLSGLVKDANYVYGGQPTEDSKRLLDVYDIVVAMGKVVKKIYMGESLDNSIDAYNEDRIIVTKNDNGEYVARFTAFVNEYYYYKHPLTHSGITTWNVMTNKIPREMIIAMSTDISPDGNSSFSRLHSYISQLCMQTFYNTRSVQLNGFGIETYNETPLVKPFRPVGLSTIPDETLDDSDGRFNQLTLLGANKEENGILVYNLDEKWDAYVNVAFNGWTSTVSTDHKSHKLVKAYPEATKGAYAACMSRNRDLNGDGKIQDSEIRWYLASLNEYIRMGIASRAISNAAQLYIGDKNEMTAQRYPNDYLPEGSIFYTSSYGYKDTKNKRVYWAVEKGSYGAENTYYSGELPIRCVRVLPAIESGVQDVTTVSGVIAASTVDKIDGEGLRPTVLKFKDKLVESLYRERIPSGSLASHNEDEVENSFYEGIFVAKENLKDSYRLGYLIGFKGTVGDIRYNGTKLDPCSNYSETYNGVTYRNWRMPNLVELSALDATGVIESKSSTACCTQFSNINVRYGFVLEDRIFCPGGWNKENQVNNFYHVRCVRDVPEGYFTTINP